ncbi:uncharacterized protein N7496_004573 [Penicillium cataractarum]|uniref:Uncharacterized protein n=1 Tax=Penicillium cataractarum TaxID=2100454 RepID=A0A9W9SH52_9EURO|nr:uncharacterized protein N7496_004573 [Penicillium cataractarum]KAJ5377164.1 hypothetical protein N7496_004573 [Penicillium cataractarum]
MGKKVLDDRPAYLSSDNAKYSLGVHRGPLPTGNDEITKLEQVESVGGVSLATTHRTRKQRMARHWKRFWCCYLVGNVIFLAIFLPIFFLVIIPAISQLVVNKSSLVLVNAAVMQPRPDSIQLTLQSALDLKIALPVRIEPIVLNLFNRDTGSDNPWANITIDGKTIKGNTTLGVTDTHTPFANETIWTNYVHDVVFKKESTLSLRGSTNSYLGKLKSHVTMDKDVVSPTLDSFTGFSISDATLLLPARSDGTNLIGNATLPNPSVLTIEIGTIILDIYSGSLLIGNATLEGLTLKPGNHTNAITGVLDLKKIIANLGEVLKTQASALKTGNLALDTVTRSVVWNGTEVPYYTKVMHELTLTANVGLVSTLKNTLHNLLHSDGSSSSSNLTSLIPSLNLTSDSSSVSSKLKRNVHLLDAFKDEHPVKRDAIIDSLANLYTKE